MEPKVWEEIKAEGQLSERGEYVIRSVTLEPYRKKIGGLTKSQWIDIILRVLGLLTILVPVLLFFKQRETEFSKQRALFQLDVYSNATADIHTLINKSIKESDYDTYKNNVLYKSYSKIVLLNDTAIINRYQFIRDYLQIKNYLDQGWYKCLDLDTELRAYIKRQESSKADIDTFQLQLTGIGSKLVNHKYSKVNSQDSLRIYGTIVGNSFIRFFELHQMSRPGLIDFLDWNKDSVYNKNMDILNPLREYMFKVNKWFDSTINVRTNELDSCMVRSNVLLYNR